MAWPHSTGSPPPPPGPALPAGGPGPGVPGSELPEGRPGPGVEVTTVESSVEADQLQVATVAFDVKASHDLLARAELFRLRAAPDASAGHFPGICSAPLAFDQGRQDAIGRFDAEGFVAAAVTAFALR